MMSRRRPSRRMGYVRGKEGRGNGAFSGKVEVDGDGVSFFGVDVVRECVVAYE